MSAARAGARGAAIVLALVGGVLVLGALVGFVALGPAAGLASLAPFLAGSAGAALLGLALLLRRMGREGRPVPAAVPALALAYLGGLVGGVVHHVAGGRIDALALLLVLPTAPAFGLVTGAVPVWIGVLAGGTAGWALARRRA